MITNTSKPKMQRMEGGNILLQPMMNWIDDSSEEDRNQPFFLTYLTGSTHDTYDIPSFKSWEPHDFVEDAQINKFLNEVAYTDRYLSKFTTEELQNKRNDLFKNTLFVIMGDHGANFKQRDTNTFTTYQQFTEESFDVGVTFYSQHPRISKLLQETAASDRRQQQTLSNTTEDYNVYWSSIDILPTIVDLVFQNNNDSKSDKDFSSLLDGRSILLPPKKRLSFTIPNPGDGMVFRDGSYVLLLPSRSSFTFPFIKLYDLKKDPNQEHPIIWNTNYLDRHNDNKLNKKDHDNNSKLLHWGIKAIEFVKW
eukprot:CAMPEP_0194177562 /NCGR_PEP_ID=MMETSP0154-20130528/11286_1 /TAXON_ID=1049557 /ORGANISM="Thalassiothrix antarctica, Strain L6-D1" /LENGTH=307 /DNA_ID=CAMNT_0038892163 /DNA_START=1062 /DNA_END=1983 /DNA_ORIENTATION=+